MGVKTQNKSNVTVPRYNFRRKGGRSLIERCPVFSPDGESLVVIVENVVRVYNVHTGDSSRVLETESPVDELIAVQFPESENYNLYGCSDRGLVTTWTWENGAVLREVNLAIPNGYKVLTFHVLENNECFITAHQGAEKEIFMGLYSTKTGDLVRFYKGLSVYYVEKMISVTVGWCYGERFAAIVNGTCRVYVQNLNQHKVFQCLNNTNKIRVLTVSAHNTNNAIAATDALGRTLVFHGNLFSYTQVTCETLHWHILPPMAVCFSLQGSYLYSGGMERVLVKWTEPNLATRANEKSFIPRLPGMIRHIAATHSYVAATLTNNSIVIANAQMHIISTILECGGLSAAARALDTPLAYHHRLGGLLMGGRTGHLQLFSTASDKVLYNLDITGMNNIQPERHNLIPLEMEVTCAAVSGNGSWLVTSEYRNDGVTYPEERLKFWSLQIKDYMPFKLHTLVNLSHGGCNLVCIALNNRGEFCVTAGADQKIRIWKREGSVQSQKKGKKVSVTWECLTACYYSSGVSQFLTHDSLNKYKNGSMPPEKGEHFPYLRKQPKNDIVRKIFNIHNENALMSKESVNPGVRQEAENEMGGVAISHDGSLVAAWFGCKLTLWDTHLCNLRTTLSHPALRPKGVHVQFGNEDAAHYVICTTETCLAVWSLLSLTVKWLVPIRATCLAADPLSNRLAIATNNNDVFVFTPHSSKPVLVEKRLLEPREGVFKQCTFGAAGGADVRLYLMRNDTEIYCIEPENSQEGQLEVISKRRLATTNFGALLAEQQLSEVQAAGQAAVVQPAPARAQSAVAQFLSAAPHMVPPVSLLCTSFLQHLSGKEDQDPEEQDDSAEEPMDVDPESSDEDDQETAETQPNPTQLWMPSYDTVNERRLNKIVKESVLDLHSTESLFGVD